MRRISTDYSNRLPDDYVVVVLTKEDVETLTNSLAIAEEEELLVLLNKLTDGDKGSQL